MLLLTDIKRCPACGRINTIRFDQRRCIGCQTRMFKPDDNWRLIKAEWILSGWVFFSAHSAGNFRGWVYQSHLDTPTPVIDVKTFKPLTDYNSKAKTKGSSAEYTPEQLGVQKLKDERQTTDSVVV